MVNILPLKEDFWNFQADVIPEEGIVGKIMRELHKGRQIFPFEHISPDDNRKIDRYELIQFFKAYKYPIIHVLVTDNEGPVIGQVVAEKTPTYDVRFQQVGQAQLWYSTTTKQCVLWECLLYSEVKAQAEKVWKWLLAYIKQLGMERIYTHDFDPAYQPREDYVRFLHGLGFRYMDEAMLMKGIMMTHTKETT